MQYISQFVSFIKRMVVELNKQEKEVSLEEWLRNMETAVNNYQMMGKSNDEDAMNAGNYHY